MYLFASEAVSCGHPDKCADAIADRIVDELLKIDKNARVATEVFLTNRSVIIGGEVRCCEKIPKEFYQKWAKETLEKIGYPEKGFEENETVFPEKLKYEVLINEQSEDIGIGVDKKNSLGAGDQGIIVGYACDDTKNFMPLGVEFAREIRDLLYQNALKNSHRFGVDIKCEVVLDYENKENFLHSIAKRVSAIVIAQSHTKDTRGFKDELVELIKQKSSFNWLIDEKTDFIINGTGKFVKHGFIADAGLTGRKIAIDCYGSYVPIGGGAQSSKDYTKVDRSALYGARWLAKQIVASKLAKKALVQISYAIGMEKPLNITIETFGKAKTAIEDEELSSLVCEAFEFSPIWLKDKFYLDKPEEGGFSYLQTAQEGQVGCCNYPWEKIDETERFKKLF